MHPQDTSNAITVDSCGVKRASKYLAFIHGHAKCAADSIQRFSLAQLVESTPHLTYLERGVVRCLRCLRTADNNIAAFARQHVECTQKSLQQLVAGAGKHLVVAGQAIRCCKCDKLAKSHLERFVANHRHQAFLLSCPTLQSHRLQCRTNDWSLHAQLQRPHAPGWFHRFLNWSLYTASPLIEQSSSYMA